MSFENMGLEKAEKIARALLYEGYLLYPYHPDSTKNRQRWTFGGVYPEKYSRLSEGSDPCELLSECLFRSKGSARLTVRLKFLHLIARLTAQAYPQTASGGFDQWEEAVEREVLSDEFVINATADSSVEIIVPFHFPGTVQVKPPGNVKRVQKPIHGRMEIKASLVREELYRLSVRIMNTSLAAPKDRSEALLHSMISTHFLLALQEGEYLSQIDPPEAELRDARACHNRGLWPVLVGDPGNKDLMLSSPIILYDHPQVASQSPGDLFDNAEIDEILSLRILTLTDEEKARIRAADQMGRALLDRTESLSGDDLLRLHGVLRELRPASVKVGDVELRAGSRVRLCPKKAADIFDVALRGMTAVVDSVEQDLEGRYQIAVVLEDDPGQDLGQSGQPGHRFFFKLDEVEPV